MENDELLKRAADLAERCERTSSVTHTAFLTPAEQFALTKWAAAADCKMVLTGGHQDCERKAAFFLPFYMEPDDLTLPITSAPSPQRRASASLRTVIIWALRWDSASSVSGSAISG